MSDTTAFTGFYMNRRGGMSVDREALHASEGYKRQVKALEELARMHDRDGLITGMGNGISKGSTDC